MIEEEGIKGRGGGQIWIILAIKGEVAAKERERGRERQMKRDTQTDQRTSKTN